MNATELGVLLRRIRVAAGLSLQAVEEGSDGRWKAAVVGSYERAFRAVTATRAGELLAWYGDYRLVVLEPGDVVTRAGDDAAGSAESVEWVVAYGPYLDGVIACDSRDEALGIVAHWPGAAVGFRTHHRGPVSYERSRP